MKQVLENKFDLAIAWDFEKVILAGYRWLSEKYQPGDKIFLFGFSRGAYQVRVLAGMIKTVGLIWPGNDEQIPFAYELYADLRGRNAKKGRDESQIKPMTQRFRETFSRPDVKVHFLGAWDTVSSIGVIRGKSLPATDEFNDSICYFRHALALDERRVKFLPEYVCGGDTYRPRTAWSSAGKRSASGTGEGSAPTQVADKLTAGATSITPRVKEVWFAGCHSDIGGGSTSNTELNNAAVPVLWMGNEAMVAGLKLGQSRVVWEWEKLRETRPTESLSLVWRLFEIVLFKRLSYVDDKHITWRPHVAKGRVIKPGQMIHASVAFINNYKPKANLSQLTENGWDDILRKGRPDRIDWADELEGLLEMDLFDYANVDTIMELARSDMHNTLATGRLEFLASTDKGAQAIARADRKIILFSAMLEDSEDEVKLTGAAILSKLATHGIDSLHARRRYSLFYRFHQICGGADLCNNETGSNNEKRKAQSQNWLCENVERIF